MASLAARKSTDLVFRILCYLATVLGLGALLLILFKLFYEGFSGLGIHVFTMTTPAPLSEGGLLNAIVGSLIMTVIATLVGTPLGILAGTYMAEYGRNDKATQVIRFVNDILLSAPSIVVGLFIYELVVRPMGGFSGLAGACALAIIVMPVVVRTTEDMLLLVPDQLREAASAIGAPRSFVIRTIAYRAARAGIVTGVLLAVARISGETAPLLFTALGNDNLRFSIFGELESLPTSINKFAGSAYPDLNALAWTGALIVTAAVLFLSIVARTLTSKKSGP